MRRFALPLLIAILVSTVLACSISTTDNSLAISVALTQTAAYIPPTATLVIEPTLAPTQTPEPTATTAASGTINGRVHLAAPPTPRMVVYAVDKTTGVWVSTETQPNDKGDSPFSLVVAPGTYEIYAYSDNDAYAGYTRDNWSLATVTVGANQTVSDITLSPPGESECGEMFGIPASPEGQFPEHQGPKEECKQRIIKKEGIIP